MNKINIDNNAKNEEVKNILDTVQVGAMATVNRDRTPLVSPLHFAVLGDAIIWMSSRASRHAQNAVRSGRVDFVVWNDKKQGVFLHTTALVLPEERLEAAYENGFVDYRALLCQQGGQCLANGGH